MPLGNYSWAGVDFIVFVRRNMKNGLCQFKTIRVHTRFRLDLVPNVLPSTLIDTRKAWNELINQ